MKQVHGMPQAVWERLGLRETPPVECGGLAVGDAVIFTNECGLRFDRVIVGFSEDDSFYGRFIHLASHCSVVAGDAWWFPHKPAEIVKR